jgi:hypothetical protein
VADKSQTQTPRRTWRRAGVLAALGGLAVLIAAAWLACNWNATVTAATLADARANPAALRAFLYRMPKGGDLHIHLSGGIFAERYIAWAIADRLCVQVSDYSIVNPPCDQSKGTPPIAEAVGAVDTTAKQQTYDRIVDALSMRNFRPSAAEPTGHDHFFAAFGKFGAVSGRHFEDMVVDLLAQYGAQSTQYIELMTSFSGYSERENLIKAVAGKPDFKAKLEALNEAGLAAFVAKKKQELDDAVALIEQKRACDAAKTRPGCMVSYRFIAQVSRNGTLDDVFVKTAIAAAIARADPMVVAFNYVQAEDAAVPRADYSQQMAIVRYLAGGPAGEKRVNVSLHAGELWLGLVPPADLAFHIGEAVTVAGARRIGHGVDLAFERDQAALLAEMRRRMVAVEINLTSNDQILGVRGAEHPFPAYRAAGVPVVISTDDAAVERIDLTNEYVRAARDYGLSYAELKAIARAALVYSFLDAAQKRQELAKFDRAAADFERATAARQSLLGDLCRVVRYAVGWR